MIFERYQRGFMSGIAGPRIGNRTLFDVSWRDYQGQHDVNFFSVTLSFTWSDPIYFGICVWDRTLYIQLLHEIDEDEE